jgi:hypothetical protein
VARYFGTRGARQAAPGTDLTGAAREAFVTMPLLFSYGSLLRDDVQLATFGRLLLGHRDELPGFEPSQVSIDDPQVAAKVGATHHANVTFNGRTDSSVSGMAFEITDAELAVADRYEEIAAFKRISAILASGRKAWVYVDGRTAP